MGGEVKYGRTVTLTVALSEPALLLTRQEYIPPAMDVIFGSVSVLDTSLTKGCPSLLH